MKFAAAGNKERIRCIRFLYTERHVRFDFFHETGTDMTGRYKIALSARKGTLIDMEYHRQGRLIDMNGRQCFGIDSICYGFPYIDILKARKCYDITHACLFNGSTFHSLPVEKLSDMIGSYLFPIGNSNCHSLLCRTAGNTSDCHFSEILIGFQCGRHNLESSVRIPLRCGNILQNHIKQRR